MFSAALLSLMLPLAAPLPADAPPHAVATRASAVEPSIRISLDRGDYEPGDRARVTVNVRDDGYLLVLRLSPDGYTRVLFPVDPGDDNFVRGNGSYEIRGRGDRDAFTVSSSSGTGTVYAAWSTAPFRFDGYVLGDHWDYRVLDGAQMGGDAEAALTELAQRMSTGRFDYDLTSYAVARRVASSGATHYVTMYPYPVGCGYHAWCGGGPYFSVSIGFGVGRWRSAWYDPYYYDRFYWHRPYYRYYPTYYGCYGCGYRYPRVIVIDRPVQRGYYPYQWKPGQRGGGGAPGVQYRPRSATYASTASRPASPLYEASSYRRVAESARVAPTPRRQSTTTVFGTPVGSGSSVGTARRGTAGGASVASPRSGVGAAPATPRRAGSAARTDEVRSGGATRVAPRGTDDARSGSAVPQRRGVAEPRRAEPANIERRSVEPRSVTPRAVTPRSAPQRSAPQQVRTQRVERPAPAQRAEPRSAPRSAPRAAAPRSAPAPRVSQPRAAPPTRSAPAPRSRRP